MVVICLHLSTISISHVYMIRKSGKICYKHWRRRQLKRQTDVYNASITLYVQAKAKGVVTWESWEPALYSNSICYRYVYNTNLETQDVACVSYKLQQSAFVASSKPLLKIAIFTHTVFKLFLIYETKKRASYSQVLTIRRLKAPGRISL